MTPEGTSPNSHSKTVGNQRATDFVGFSRSGCWVSPCWSHLKDAWRRGKRYENVWNLKAVNGKAPLNYMSAGWWFQTFVVFPYIWRSIPNWLTFFRGVQTTILPAMFDNGDGSCHLRFEKWVVEGEGTSCAMHKLNFDSHDAMVWKSEIHLNTRAWSKLVWRGKQSWDSWLVRWNKCSSVPVCRTSGATWYVHCVGTGCGAGWAHPDFRCVAAKVDDVECENLTVSHEYGWIQCVCVWIFVIRCVYMYILCGYTS